ncbi:MAG: CHASE2 domain-containing protein [Duncaniella sp.]|nr:CHASE2 domain-containing protein [Duncaniella sp.]
MKILLKPIHISPTLRRIFISVGIAFGIILAEYLLGNWFNFLFDDSSLLSVVHSILPQYNDEEDDVVFFNVGFDKQLVAVRDEFGDSIGNTAITDRSVLMKFLDIAERADYRYIFLDVRFEEGVKTDIDSLLFQKIKGMPRVVISTHSQAGGYQIADSSLLPKAAFADYFSTYFSGFTSYSYLQDDKESVALRLFRDLDGGDVVRRGPLFFSNGRLCNNMQFLMFRDEDILDPETPLSKYPPFGGEVLNVNSEDELLYQMKGKIVVVGDMDNDTHTTYAGNVQGPLLNIRAYDYLRKGRHCLNPFTMILLFVVYASISFSILYSRPGSNPGIIRNQMLRHPLLSFFCLALGWSFVLFVLKILFFSIFKTSILIAIPSTVFSILSMPNNYIDFRKELC